MIALLKIYLLTVQVTLLSFGGINPFWALFERQAVRQCDDELRDPAEFAVCRDDFNTVFILSKVLPGPHVGPASILGYQAQGVAGMLAVLFGLLTPGLVITPLLFHFYKQYGHRPALQAFFKGASFASLAILGVFLITILSAQFTGGAARVLGTSAVFAASFGLSFRFRLNPMLAVVGGGLAGFLFLQ